MTAPRATRPAWPRLIGVRAALRVARHVLVAALAAFGVLVVGGRVNPASDHAPDPAPDPVLARRIDDVTLDASTLANAVASLRRATRTPITLDGRSLEAAGFHDGLEDVPPRPVRLRGRTLAGALDELFRAVAGDQFARMLGYRVEGGTIVIQTSEQVTVNEPRQVRAYDVGDLAADCRRYPQRATMSGGAREADRTIRGGQAVGILLRERVSSVAWDGPARGDIAVWGDTLLIDAPADVHWDVQRLLFLVRNPQPPAAPPAAPQVRP